MAQWEGSEPIVVKPGEEIPLEIVKEAAKKLGYRLVPEPKYISLKPCKCGRKRIVEWFDTKNYTWFYKCPECDREAPAGKSHSEARRLWNETIEKGDI